MTVRDANFILDALAGILAEEHKDENGEWKISPSIDTLSTLPISGILDNKEVFYTDVFDTVRGMRDNLNNQMMGFSKMYPKNYHIKLGVFYEIGEYINYTLYKNEHRIGTYIVRQDNTISLRRGTPFDKYSLCGITLSLHTYGDTTSYNPTFGWGTSVKIDGAFDNSEEMFLRAQDMIKECNKIMNHYKISYKDIDPWFYKEGVTLL